MANISVLVAIIMIFTGSYLPAQDCDKLEAEGRFSSKDEDSLDLVKKELLFDAYRNLITQKMNCMGLDSKMFWEKFDLDFEKSFEATAEALKKTTDSGQGDSKDEFEKKLRMKRLVSKREFGSLDRLIVSYSILKMSRSTQYPNSRFINITGKVDPGALGDLYYKYTDSNQKRTIEQMLVSTQVKLTDLTWSELGVKTETDFSDSLKDSWMKWLFANWGRFFKGVYVVSDLSISDLEKIKSTTGNDSSSVSLSVSKSMSKNAQEQTVTSGKESIKVSSNSVWINFSIGIKKLQDNKMLNKKEFEYSGYYIIKDLMSGEIVGHYDFPTEKKSYFMDEINDFASSIASYTYNLPLSNLTSQSKKISSLVNDENKLVLELQNISSVKDILSFNEELVNKGVRFQLRPTLESYAGDKGQILLSYQGATEDVKKFLSGLKNSKIGTSKLITFVDDDNPYVLKLITISQEDSGETKSR
ncbi:MAG: hypothetical protein A2381_20215 [Bdellovibrionales bacterium RIFOXYB1_FULL_37_110]|nr:MAG: hypothetical protein A2181_03850 [Bdellovibrionales bacterium RIFOXYA1_FULL_38_20]OFZ51061.1 MAG: hypothetical protein A2417_20000 [Bdellovibrionales bacterium RIFOXYC1_FULL_37_79]OFZ60273.1 MAG: hypothetical protein A2381_20215 [Bdellovibrionales bacterium RIFOXYB1_FULL_37_110]OFZ63268.1 MAG: hypothetical protein A2577_01530 [Bdellovibrionales bacterium RIFOXYD1_FULL_36_51]